MLWHMLSRPGTDLSPLASAAWMRRRAISGRDRPRASRCWRSHAPSSFDITPSFTVRTVTDTVRVRERPCVSPAPEGAGDDAASWWSGEEVVGEAGRGAVDEGADLVGFQDERGAGRVGGLAQCDPAAGELLGFPAVAAIVAPRRGPALSAEFSGGHSVTHMLCAHVRSPS